MPRCKVAKKIPFLDSFGIIIHISALLIWNGCKELLVDINSKARGIGDSNIAVFNCSHIVADAGTHLSVGGEGLQHVKIRHN